MNPGWMVLFDQALSGKHARQIPQPPQQRTSSPSAPRLSHGTTTGAHSAPAPRGDRPEVSRGGHKKKPLPPPQKPPNEGLYPDDAQVGPWYDPEDGCREAQEPSYDVSGGKKVVVRSSWSEGLYDDQTQCCDAVYHNADRCSAYDASICDPLGPFKGSRQCTDGDAPADPTSGGSGGKCRTIPGKLICGQDCPGKECFQQTDCIKVDGAGQTDVVYAASFPQCCVDYTALHGEMRQRPAFDEDTGKDEVLERCKGIMERRVTDYRKQKPKGPGGYRDRGEFRPRRS